MLLLCKSAGITEPHLEPTHLSKPGSNATSNPEDAFCRHPPALLRLDCPQLTGLRPNPLLEALNCPRHVRDSPDVHLDERDIINGAFGDPRSCTGAWPGGEGGSAAAPPSHPSQAPRIQNRTTLCDRPAAVARRPEEANQGREPRGGACPTDHRRTPLGHPWGTGNRLRRQGLGRLLTILPWYPLAPNLACINEAAPYGENPEATRPDTAYTDTLAPTRSRTESRRATRPPIEIQDVV